MPLMSSIKFWNFITDSLKYILTPGKKHGYKSDWLNKSVTYTIGTPMGE